jgi:hypothetical protein
LAGFVEGVGEDGKDDFALRAADEVEAAFLLDELELGRHSVNGERAKSRSLGFARDDKRLGVGRSGAGDPDYSGQEQGK